MGNKDLYGKYSGIKTCEYDSRLGSDFGAVLADPAASELHNFIIKELTARIPLGQVNFVSGDGIRMAFGVAGAIVCC